VNLVLILHINQGSRTILIEKWECTPVTGGTVTQLPALIPTKMQQITIDPNNITGNSPPPLILDFHQIFLRQPNAGEHNLVFTAQNLQGWDASVWAALS